MKENWKYTAATGEAYTPYLHDCVATKINVDGSEMTLDLPDGFWLLPDDPRNPWDEVHKTGPAQIVVSLGYPMPSNELDDAIFAELFHRRRLCRGVAWTTCTYPAVEKLIEKVNSGKWDLEFVWKYPTYDRGWLVEGYFHTGRKTRKCYLTVDFRQIRFFWNEIRGDRVW